MPMPILASETNSPGVCWSSLFFYSLVVFFLLAFMCLCRFLYSLLSLSLSFSVSYLTLTLTLTLALTLT